jgi:hypothetical protein
MATASIPTREDIFSTFAELSAVLHAALRPLPTQTGDHTYLRTDEPDQSLLKQLKALNIENAGTIKDVITHLGGRPTDDKTYIMERVMRLASQLPLTSSAGKGVTSSFLTQLWDDLKHPPLSYLGDDFIYRKADGSNNNILWPHIGAAGVPYARTVKPLQLQPIALPDPGVVFDSLMARRDYKEHPNKISSVLFYLASIIIHDVFRTNRTDFNISDTSSYLDLAPLYGSNQDEQDMMRTFKDGKIKPDCFSEKRILGFPPGVGVLLIMFNRFHNYVVEQLAVIDENGRFSSIRRPLGQATHEDIEAKYDNALFQTGRLITGGLYIQIILKDYVRTILNLNRTDSKWDLDPRSADGKTLFGEGAGEAVGNQVSAEFNLVYRWHSCISKKDEEWTKSLYRKMFPGAQSHNLWDIVKKLSDFSQSLPKDPHERSFANLARTPNGSYRDEDLASIFAANVDDPAGAFGANQVPEVLRDIEILGIMQARSWKLASLNEFRKFFKLVPHKTFEDINPDPYVAEQLKRLYDHPDFVEMYPGLVVEDAKHRVTPGSGLCPGYTISRAVLSDAVALVRGDRFYTVDYTPKNLTNWGFTEADSDLTVDNGHVFYKLVLRAFPRNFREDSIYAHYPMVIPDENQKILSALNTARYYNFEKPGARPELSIINSYAASKTILQNQADYKVTWGVDAIDFLVRVGAENYGQNFMLSGDGLQNAKSRELMWLALYPGAKSTHPLNSVPEDASHTGRSFGAHSTLPQSSTLQDNSHQSQESRSSNHPKGSPGYAGCPSSGRWVHEVKAFYEDITLRLLHQNSYQIAGVNQVDIVRDVSNFAQVHFASSVFSLPLKTEQNPHGIYTESELYTVLALVFTCIFYDGDPTKSFPLRQAARTLAQQLGKLVEFNVQCVNTAGFVATILDRFHKHNALTDYGIHLVRTLLANEEMTVKDVVYTNILPTAGGMVAIQSQVFSQCLDYYLSEGKEHLPDIHRLSMLDDPEADDVLLH